MSSVILEDEDLEKLLCSGVILNYKLTDNYKSEVGSQSLEITFLGGQKLLVCSWSGPAPESSGLYIESIL